MIELPEAVTIVRQLQRLLPGRQIVEVVRGASPHKLAFWGPLDAEAYAHRLTGQTVHECTAYGAHPLLWLGGADVLALGGGGERILYHESDATIPLKHQLLLRFDNGAYLSVTISGGGAVYLLERGDLAHPKHIRYGRPQPLTDGFRFDGFVEGFVQRQSDDRTSVKHHLISEPGVPGLGNGYLQDILFSAELHPRRPAAEVSESERHKLFCAIESTFQRAVDLGGRDTERDAYGERGKYVALMDTRTKGQPCPRCGSRIEKISFLGGSCYLCPTCQR